MMKLEFDWFFSQIRVDKCSELSSSPFGNAQVQLPEEVLGQSLRVARLLWQEKFWPSSADELFAHHFDHDPDGHRHTAAKVQLYPARNLLAHFGVGRQSSG